ncbi:MAG: DinB family protein [Chloroflexaceae bacterium]|jgi:uncharacterized damage-inducible protein DinB|nr:DinB family protein [Chloroflexaceae bacterium]
MHTTDVQTLYDYNSWANQRILTQAAQLSTEQLRAPAPFPMGSLHNTLVHLLASEWLWRVRMHEGVSPPALLDPATFSDLAAIEARWAEDEQVLRAYLASLNDSDLTRTVTYTNLSGMTRSETLSNLLHHVVLHGMQHRSECAAMLTNYGYSPGNIDLIVYLQQ